MTSKTLPDDYRERVYAGWLGKCIGVHFGGPFESWTYQDICTNVGEVTGYLQPKGEVFKPDDDLIMPLVMMEAMKGSSSPEEVTAEAIGNRWLDLLSVERGAIWRGGYGASSEHTAYINLLNGISAPHSGSAALNGNIMAEQIGGQIFSDIWGLVLPNAPEAAADLSQKAASVSHDGEGINGGRFVASLVSAAFSEADPLKLIEAGLRVVPKESEYARVIKDMVRVHEEHPDNWHTARQYIDEHWGYDRYQGAVPILPNAAIILIALLYGGGDFSRSIQIANMSGWDTDCNVGNVGAIMGVAVGLDGIAPHWREPLNDFIVSASIQGTRNIVDIPATASFLVACGQRFAGETVAEETLPRFDFEFPGATHGFTYEKRRCRVVNLQQSEEQAFSGRGSLRITLDRLNRKGEARIYRRTHFRVEELSSNHYEASFSPQIYPGQKLSVQIYVPDYLPDFILVALFVRDRTNGFSYQPPGRRVIPGEWNEISMEIPHFEDVCISDVGLDIRSLKEDPWSGTIYLDAFDWGGAPNYATRLSQLKENGKTITGWTTYRGYWRVDGGYCGSGVDFSETYTGDIDWQNYKVTVGMQPLIGKQHMINLRVQGGLSAYALGFVEADKIGILKKVDGVYQQAAAQSCDWTAGQIYRLTAQAQGTHLSLTLDGERLLTWEDNSAPYLHGQVGLSNGPKSHTRFTTFQIEPVA